MESTGDIVFVGKEKRDDAAALHIYRYKNRWQKIGTNQSPCCHESCILPVMIENNERLLVSCSVCNTIWFCDIDSGTFSEALKKVGFFPGLMCNTEGDCIFIENYVEGPIYLMKVKCTPSGLVVVNKINSRLENIFSICYLPNVKCVALSSWRNYVVKVIHCETGDEVWELKGEVEGIAWKPHGLLYSQEHYALLVCDMSGDGRMVVLNPSDGCVLQKIPLRNLRHPISLSVHEGTFILLSRFVKSRKISLFTVE